MKRAASWESLTDCSVAEFTPTTSSWCTVLLPFPGAKQPEVQVELVKGGPGQAVRLKRPDGDAVFIFQDSATQGSYDNEQVRFAGESALFRRQGNADRTFSAKSCRSFTVDGQVLFSSKAPCDADVRWLGRQIIISAASGAEIRSSGAASAIINGVNAAISGKADVLVVP
jgi:hypothetical protein